MTGQCGTYQWMAPEVIAGHVYTEKADVFSFGVILWEMFTRKVPYEGMQPMQVLTLFSLFLCVGGCDGPYQQEASSHSFQLP